MLSTSLCGWTLRPTWAVRGHGHRLYAICLLRTFCGSKSIHHDRICRNTVRRVIIARARVLCRFLVAICERSHYISDFKLSNVSSRSSDIIPQEAFPPGTSRKTQPGAAWATWARMRRLPVFMRAPVQGQLLASRAHMMARFVLGPDAMVDVTDDRYDLHNRFNSFFLSVLAQETTKTDGKVY